VQSGGGGYVHSVCVFASIKCQSTHAA